MALNEKQKNRVLEAIEAKENPTLVAQELGIKRQQVETFMFREVARLAGIPTGGGRARNPKVNAQGTLSLSKAFLTGLGLNWQPGDKFKIKNMDGSVLISPID